MRKICGIIILAILFTTINANASILQSDSYGTIQGTINDDCTIRIYDAITKNEVFVPNSTTFGIKVRFGNYVIEQVPVGNYRLSVVSTSIGGGAIPQWYKNAIDFEHATDVTVTANSITENIDIEIEISPDLIPSETSFDFGSLVVFSQSSPHTFSVTLGKPIPFTITKVYLTGADMQNFSIRNDEMTGRRAFEDNLTCDIVFTPFSTGTKNATLVIEDDNTTSEAVYIALTGTATDLSSLKISSIYSWIDLMPTTQPEDIHVSTVATVENLSTNLNTPINVYCALYSNGKLIQIKKTSISFLDTTPQQLIWDFYNIDISNEYECKIFIWAKDSLIPMLKSSQVTTSYVY